MDTIETAKKIIRIDEGSAMKPTITWEGYPTIG